MFRTPIILEKSPEKINIQDTLFLTGSCFSENIGQKLTDNKFNCLINPFGIIYNPVTILKLLNDALFERSINEKYIVRHQGIYRHFDYHSDISARTKNELIDQADEACKFTKIYLLKAKWVILTFGTAMVYRHNKLNKIVGNCHKLPASTFTRERLHPEDILKAFQDFYSSLSKENQDFRILLTVSPVRHLKDSLETNSVSKSILRYACQLLSETFDRVYYYPSYEIMMDDLRDYRFYKPDMLHPSMTAIDYIWNTFQECYFDDETLRFIHEWKKIWQALNHRPFYPDSDEHRKFIRKTIQQLKNFSDKVDISGELKQLESQIQ